MVGKPLRDRGWVIIQGFCAVLEEGGGGYERNLYISVYMNSELSKKRQGCCCHNHIKNIDSLLTFHCNANVNMMIFVLQFYK